MKAQIKKIIKGSRQAIGVSLMLMLICGLIFPIMLTGISSVLFPKQAEGSLIIVNGKAVAAEQVGQEFKSDFYMWSRPSAYHYNVYSENADGTKTYSDGTEFQGIGSGSENLAPSNPELVKRVEKDIQEFLVKNPEINCNDLPTDLLTASGSGLDPHISPQSAEIQIPRIVKASGLTELEVREIVKNNTTDKLFGILGEETVNVVKVNIDIAMAMDIL